MLEKYRKVYSMLGDEESRNIYLNRLNWLISGDLKYIDKIVTAYLPQSFSCPLYGKSLEESVLEIQAKLPAERGIVLYGAGGFAPYILHYFENDKRLIGFCSQTKKKQETGFCGWPVMSPEELLHRKDLSVILSVREAKPKNEIKQVLKEGGYPEDQVYEVPEIVIWNDPEQYFGPDFMTLEPESVFIDAGCFDLETSMEFKRRCPCVKKIYAFEPDPDGYQRCVERKRSEALSEAELLPYGVWSERTTLYFYARNDPASRVSAVGTVSVPVISIDEAIDPGDRVTIMKMDIEGSELEGLKGARKTIQRDKPKLAICIYHRLEDMTEIPLYIKELVPEYKLYVRHHSSCDSETVLYAVLPQDC